MKKLVCASLALLTMSSYADDFRTCNNGVLFGRLNDKGEIQALPGEKISSQAKVDDKDHITFEDVEGNKTSLIVERNSQGKITSASTEKDLSKLTSKERDGIRYREAYKVAFDGLPGMCQWSRTQSPSSNEVSLNSRECPKILVYNNEQQGYVPANYKMINKGNFSQFKLKGIKSWEEFESIRDEDRKRWSADAKIVQAYSDALEKQGWTYPTGTKMSLDYQDGNCFIKKISETVINGKNGAKSENTTYENSKCDSMRKIFQKYSKDINKCDLITGEALKELKTIQTGKRQSTPERFELNLITKEESLCNMYSSIVQYKKESGSGTGSGSNSSGTKSE